MGGERDVVSLFEAAFKFAKKRSRCEEFAHDFASWLVTKNLEGYRLTQPIKLSFIDYLRQERGHESRSEDKFNFFRNKKQFIEGMYPDFEGLSDKERKLIAKDLLKLVNEEEEKIIYLYFYEGYSFSEIGKLYQMSESGACNKLKNILHRIKSKVSGKTTPKKRPKNNQS